MPLRYPGNRIFKTEVHAELERILSGIRPGHSVRVLLRGEKGLGKTAAVRYLLQTLPIRNLLLLEGSASPVRAAYYPVAQAMGSLAAQASRMERVREIATDRFADALKYFPPLAMFAEWIPQLSKLFQESPTTVTEPGNFAFQVQKVFAKVARSKNVVILFRNLDSYDPSSLTLIDTLLRNRSTPVSYVFTYDPLSAAGRELADREAMENVTANMLQTQGVEPLDLRPLTASETTRFVDEVLHSHSLSATDTLSIHGVTGGNPGFILELLSHLQDTGDLVVRHGSFSLQPRLSFKDLPADMARLIDLRVNRLQEDLRSVIDVAAVMGTEFQAEPITYALELTHLITLQRLQKLQRLHRMIVEEMAAHRFTYEAIRTRVYQQLGPSIARDQHVLIAGFFAAHPLPFDNDYIIQIHLAAAGKLGEALPHLVRAAEQARVRGSWLEAGDRFVDAAKMAEQLGLEVEYTQRLWRDGAGCFQDAGKFDQAVVLYHRILTSAASPRLLAIAALNMALCKYLLEDNHRAIEALNGALATHSAHLTVDEKVHARLTLASALYHTGAWDAARSQYRKCYRDGMVRTDPVLLAHMHKNINMFYLPELAVPYLERSRQALGDNPQPLRWELQHNLACNYLFMGELEAAAGLFEECMLVFDEMGNYRAAYPTNNLGITRMLLGRYDDADRLFRQVGEAPLGEFDRISAECHLAVTQVLRENPDPGIRTLRELVKDRYVESEPVLREFVRHNLGWSLSLAGERDEAEHYLLAGLPERPHLWKEFKVGNTARILDGIGCQLRSPALRAGMDLLATSWRKDKWLLDNFNYWVSEVWFWE